MKNYICILIILFLMLFDTNNAQADQPLYELGVFVGHGALADYPASDEYRYRTIPFPYLVFRGDLLKSDDREGTRIEIFNNSQLDVDLSFGGSFPTDGQLNQARQGMPPLDWTLEIGPRLIYYFYKNEQGYLRLGFPVRGSFATDFNFTKIIGSTIAPTLQYDRYGFLSDSLDIYAMLTYQYITKGVAEYFYEVSPEFQTSTRRAYQAQEGPLSWDSAIGLRYRFGSSFIVIGTRYSDLSISSNKLSDLHRTNVNWSYLVGFGINLYSSEQSTESR